MPKVIGYIKKIYPMVEGDSKTTMRHWQKQDFIAETGGQYTEDMGFSVWNCKANINYPVGTKVEISFSIRSEERLSDNGNIFLTTALSAYKVEPVQENRQTYAPAPATAAPTAPAAPAKPSEIPRTEDLPF